MPGRHYLSGPDSSAWPGLIEAYRSRLPVGADTPVITLYAGGTPLFDERTGRSVPVRPPRKRPPSKR